MPEDDKMKFVFQHICEYTVFANDEEDADKKFQAVVEHGIYVDDINKSREILTRSHTPDQRNEEVSIWSFNTHRWEKQKYLLKP